MRTTFVSTLSLNAAPASGLERKRAELAKLSTEVVTGRRADAGLDLGGGAAQVVALRHRSAILTGYIDGNAAVRARLQQADAALGAMAADADTFRDALIAGGNGNASATKLETAAAGALQALIGYANAGDGKRHLFGGENSAEAPLAAFADGPAAAVSDAFAARFGMAAGDPAASTIGAAEMADFLDTAFADLFADPAWGATWSRAADGGVSVAIGPSESLTASVSANEPAFRKLAMAYTMVAALGIGGLSAETRQVVVDKATAAAGAAGTGLIDLRATLGAGSERLAAADQRLAVEKDIAEQHLAALEGVDPAAAKTRIDLLSTQIQMSYALTVQVSRLSILNYA